METMFSVPELSFLNSRLQYVGQCWLWTACKYDSGYGMVKRGGKLNRVHRLVYEELFGETPDDVHHTCHIRACCNPDHLSTIDHREHGRQHGKEGRPGQPFCPKHKTEKLFRREGSGKLVRRCRECLNEK